MGSRDVGGDRRVQAPSREATEVMVRLPEIGGRVDVGFGELLAGRAVGGPRDGGEPLGGDGPLAEEAFAKNAVRNGL